MSPPKPDMRNLSGCGAGNCMKAKGTIEEASPTFIPYLKRSTAKLTFHLITKGLRSLESSIVADMLSSELTLPLGASSTDRAPQQSPSG